MPITVPIYTSVILLGLSGYLHALRHLVIGLQDMKIPLIETVWVFEKVTDWARNTYNLAIVTPLLSVSLIGLTALANQISRIIGLLFQDFTFNIGITTTHVLFFVTTLLAAVTQLLSHHISKRRTQDAIDYLDEATSTAMFNAEEKLNSGEYDSAILSLSEAFETFLRLKISSEYGFDNYSVYELNPKSLVRAAKKKNILDSSEADDIEKLFSKRNEIKHGLPDNFEIDEEFEEKLENYLELLRNLIDRSEPLQNPF